MGQGARGRYLIMNAHANSIRSITLVLPHAKRNSAPDGECAPCCFITTPREMRPSLKLQKKREPALRRLSLTNIVTAQRMECLPASITLCMVAESASEFKQEEADCANEYRAYMLTEISPPRPLWLRLRGLG